MERSTALKMLLNVNTPTDSDRAFEDGHPPGIIRMLVID